MKFPESFLWGAASAAYQIEGSVDADGKGRSIWDDFVRKPGVVNDGSTGDTACDGYRRYREDVALMARLGIQSYRFSVAWTRVFPEGRGRQNPAGLAYYSDVVDALLAAGIEPCVTLYHWDLPAALEAEGGWRNRKTAEAFGAFAEAVAERFAGRVKLWVTLNEPQCAVGYGYGSGTNAPGLQLTDEELAVCYHNQLIAHGLAARAIRRFCPDAKIGLASTGKICCPADEADPENLAAAEKATFRMDSSDWNSVHTWFLDGAVFGHYPEEAPDFLQRFRDSVPESDWEIIKQPLDYVGLNIYHGQYVDCAGRQIPFYDGYPRTGTRWPIVPEAMHDGPLFAWRRWGLPVFITENGASCNDHIFLDGKVHDPGRTDFLTRYLRELGKTAADGVPLGGYYHWCFTDNFEWERGFRERFGLIYCDYRTQERIPKDSAYWYREVAASNGGIL
ncbi:MAG TPA: GH1 family beta-glucosidase [Oscillospiraceae bacterium]|nr:GH1 family beta-glucosidase [Oscillospiraceae bacterium]HXK77822.1 GH1 family beta-glucosidase [Oscillospiraceae bacterium]